MGIDSNFAGLLFAAQKSGARFDRTLTVGRLRMEDGSWAESFLRSLGATSVDSLDASNYENATIIHDLNEPPNDPGMRNHYNAVIDGGTLEHVFNFPEAVRTCMESVSLDGRIFLHTPVNNFCGHGFYQFCPELFYTIFSEPNGFRVEHMIIYRLGPMAHWYEVANPAEIKSRVELISYTFTMLMVQARRTELRRIFQEWPQQSLYAADWQGQSWENKPLTPLGFHLHHSLRNKRFFRRIKKLKHE